MIAPECPNCGEPIDISEPEKCRVNSDLKLEHVECESQPQLPLSLEPVRVEEPLINVVPERNLQKHVGSIPKPVRLPELTRQQEMNIEILSYGQAIADQLYDPATIHRLWPTAPSEKWRAGERPNLEQIQAYQATEDFRDGMRKRGIEVSRHEELSVEQYALLSILTDYSDKRSLNSKLRAAGVKSATYRGWLRQKAFNDKLRAIAGKALDEAIPIAEANLAAGAAQGDLKYIKFLMEVTGRHDPARQQQVDTQALIGVIIDTMQECINEENMENMSAKELLAHIQEQIKFRAQGVKGVIR